MYDDEAESQGRPHKMTTGCLGGMEVSLETATTGWQRSLPPSHTRSRGTSDRGDVLGPSAERHQPLQCRICVLESSPQSSVTGATFARWHRWKVRSSACARGTTEQRGQLDRRMPKTSGSCHVRILVG